MFQEFDCSNGSNVACLDSVGESRTTVRSGIFTTENRRNWTLILLKFKLYC